MRLPPLIDFALHAFFAMLLFAAAMPPPMLIIDADAAISLLLIFAIFAAAARGCALLFHAMLIFLLPRCLRYRCYSGAAAADCRALADCHFRHFRFFAYDGADYIRSISRRRAIMPLRRFLHFDITRHFR